MQKLYIGLLPLSLACLMACSSEKKEPTESTVTESAAIVDTSIAPVMQPPAEITSSDPGMTVAPPPAATTTTTVTAAATGKLNPPHGEPGHRCEIAVGAPLDSKPAENKATQPTVIQSAPTIK